MTLTMKRLRQGVIEAGRTRQLTEDEKSAWDAVKKTGTQDSAEIEAAKQKQDALDEQEGRPKDGFHSDMPEM